MPHSSSALVKALVLRELEDGKRHDGLWLQALSESKLDQNLAQLRYIELRTQSMQQEMKSVLIDQIRSAVALKKK